MSVMCNLEQVREGKQNETQKQRGVGEAES